MDSDSHKQARLNNKVKRKMRLWTWRTGDSLQLWWASDHSVVFKAKLDVALIKSKKYLTRLLILARWFTTKCSHPSVTEEVKKKTTYLWKWTLVFQRWGQPFKTVQAKPNESFWQNVCFILDLLNNLWLLVPNKSCWFYLFIYNCHGRLAIVLSVSKISTVLMTQCIQTKTLNYQCHIKNITSLAKNSPRRWNLTSMWLLETFPFHFT